MTISNLSPRAAIIRIPGSRNPQERDPEAIYLELIQCVQEMMINQRSDEVLQIIFDYKPITEDIE